MEKSGVFWCFLDGKGCRFRPDYVRARQKVRRKCQKWLLFESEMVKNGTFRSFLEFWCIQERIRLEFWQNGRFAKLAKLSFSCSFF